MLRLLLLSDIHFLSLYEEMDPHATLRGALEKDLSDYRKAYGKIDHILVCGDIAYKGIKEEYDKAHVFFEHICDIVGCQPEEIYIVPGNHDKNFNTPKAEIRHLIHAGLSNEKAEYDKLFTELLHNNFTHFKILYQPFKDYQDFAVRMVSCEPLMTKCLDEAENAQYDNEKDKAYMMTQLGTIGSYPVMLYAMNTALCCDWDDVNDFEKGHKLFLPKLSYNTKANKDGCINIAMMHHPSSRLVNEENIAASFNKQFQIQIFGHLHQPASYVNEAVHIHSGALQPQEDQEDKSEGYFSVYNILELEVTSKNGEDELNIQLKVEQYDNDSNEFVENGEESRNFVLPLKKHKNRWIKENPHQIQPKALPEGVTDRTVKYKFLQLTNPRSIMRRMRYSYDENKSHNRNCVDFLNTIQSEQRFAELWDAINQE